MRGKHSFFIPTIPFEFYPLIGIVTVFWAYLEAGLDSLLHALLKETQQRKPLWQTLSFKKRSNMLRTVLHDVFPRRDPRLKCLLPILDKAAAIQWRRNLLVHGKYTLVCPPNKLPRLKVSGYIDRKPITTKITKVELEEMYHDLTKLMGELNSLFDLENPHAPLPLQERCTLRELLRRHLSGSTEPIPERPPQS
jgi:hypothetical protein